MSVAAPAPAAAQAHAGLQIQLCTHNLTRRAEPKHGLCPSSFVPAVCVIWVVCVRSRVNANMCLHSDLLHSSIDCLSIVSHEHASSTCFTHTPYSGHTQQTHPLTWCSGLLTMLLPTLPPPQAAAMPCTGSPWNAMCSALKRRPPEGWR